MAEGLGMLSPGWGGGGWGVLLGSGGRVAAVGAGEVADDPRVCPQGQRGV